MEKLDHTKISVDDYRQIESKIDSIKSEEELIETHKKLNGISCKCDSYEIKDCGVEFIRKFLSRNWGRSIVYHYSQGAESFIKSKYLSDYFKNSIIDLLSNENISEEALNALNSDKLINDMTEKEILSIYSAIKDYYTQPLKTKSNSVANYLMPLLYKLNGSGVVSFIKNNVSNRDLASNILLTSGLNDRASFYSGRGVNFGDLNEKHLVAIFKKLLKIDVNYAINFVEMVNQMKTLGATEFINTFMNFADNGFKVESLNVEDSNVSLDGLHGDARNMVAFISVYTTMSRENNLSDQIRTSKDMKTSFMSIISPVLQSIKTNFDELGIQLLNCGYRRKK